jgi:two-component system chemotaxis response regulator CheB
MIRVLVVDDSAVVRRILSEELHKASDIDVVGTAADAFIARDKILRLKPDVVTPDLEMPRMDGLTFLKKVMKYQPLPIIVVSSLTQHGSRSAVKALECGAVDVVGKPGSSGTVGEIVYALADKIRAAASTRLDHRPKAAEPAVEQAAMPQQAIKADGTVLAIGASTGGTEAIRNVLVGLPADCPPVLIVQHLPAHFTAAFAERLNQICLMTVREAQNGDRLEPGTVFVAPGDYHMALRREGRRRVIEIKRGPQVFHQRPSVDVLFHSIAQQFGSSAVGMLLTGMGGDGARGLLAMKEAGAYTIAQDEPSCVVFGMPKEAIRMDAATRVLPLDQMSKHFLDLLIQRSSSGLRRSG